MMNIGYVVFQKPSEVFFLHRWQDEPRGMEDSIQVQCNDVVPLADREVVDIGDVLDAGVVDENVDTAALLAAHHPLYLVDLHEICVVEEDLDFVRVGHVLQQRLNIFAATKTIQHDVAPPAGEGLGYAQTDTRGGPCHQGKFGRQRHEEEELRRASSSDVGGGPSFS